MGTLRLDSSSVSNDVRPRGVSRRRSATEEEDVEDEEVVGGAAATATPLSVVKEELSIFDDEDVDETLPSGGAMTAAELTRAEALDV